MIVTSYCWVMRRVLFLFAIGLAACGGASSSSQVSGAPAVATSSEPPQSSPVAPDDLRPGTVDIRRTTMSDGTEITYGLILPKDFDSDKQYPVLLALPPGDQSVGLMTSLAESTYAEQAMQRGWVVITPAAPDGVLFFQGSEQYIPEFLDQLAWIKLEGGRYHIAGVSNGGRSTFRIATLEPERFASVLVFPGFPAGPTDAGSLADLAKLPVAMFVGGEDPGWIGPMRETADTLESLGGTVTLDIRNGEGHIMRSLSDGVDIFDFLDSVRP